MRRELLLGYDTYLGGYSEFRPLTSSTDAAVLINKANEVEGVTEDISGRGRDLGGIPDLGAYEADLPESGTVYYVRNTGEDSEGYGLSWEKPFATVRKAVETAAGTKLPNGARPQVWVAAGIYEQDPKNGSQNCFEILEGVNVYGAFPNSGAPGMDERHPFVSNSYIMTGLTTRKIMKRFSGLKRKTKQPHAVY